MRSRRKSLVLLGVLAILVSGAVWPWGAHRDRKVSHQLLSSPMHSLCVGRYLIDVPAQYELEGYGYRIDGVEIEGLPDIKDVSSFRQKVGERELQIKSAINEFGSSSLEQRIDIDQNFASGVLFVHGRTKPDYGYINGKKVFTSDGLTGEAWLWIENNAFQITGKDMGPDRVAKIAGIANHVRAIGSNEVPGAHGYCMEISNAKLFIPGAPDPEQNEMTSIEFGLKDHPDFKFRWVMYTNGDKLDEPLLVRRAKAQSEFSTLMSFFTRLRGGKRTINGIEGDELVESVREDPGIRVHSFGWEQLGEPNNPMKPEMNFEAKTGYSNSGPVPPSLSDEAAIKLWDAIVGSIRLRPTGPAKASSGEGSAAPKPKTPVGTNVHTGSVCPESG